MKAPPPAVVTATGRVRKLSQDEIDLLKRTVAKGTSDDEFAMFLWFCRNHQVDPVAQEVYCIMRWDSKRDVVGYDEKTERPIYQGGMKMTIQMGIGGLRGLAARKHKDYGSTDEPVWNFGTRKTPAQRKIPEFVTVGVWKKGASRPTQATIFWDEFAPTELASPKGQFWNYSPANQLAKCAEAQALRKAYPDLNNIYIPEELARTAGDYTEDGRLIVEADGRTPSGEPARADVFTHRGQQAAIDAEVEKQKKGEKPSAVEEIRGARKVDSPGAVQQGVKEKQPPASPPATKPAEADPTPFKGKIEVDWSDKNSPIVRGDLENVLDVIKKHCKCSWGADSWWHVLPTDVQTLREMCRAYHFEFIEIFPHTQKGSTVKPPEKKKPAAPAETTVIAGTLERVTAGMTSKNAPTRQVKLASGAWYTCYRNTIFDFLDKGLGKEAELYLDNRKNIVGVKRIAGRQFMEDGVTPIVDSNEPRGGSLFDK